MTTKIINMTPHAITVIDENGQKTTYESKGVARVMSVSPTVEQADIPHSCVGLPQFGEVLGLPEPQKGVFYLVSLLCLQNSDRWDLLAPDTGPESVVRSQDGQIIGVKRLIVRTQLSIKF